MKPATRYMTDEEHKQVYNLRRAGLRLEDIAQRLGRTVHAVRRSLNAQAVPRQRLFKVPPARQALFKRITNMALQGKSEAQVACELNVTVNVVRNTVRRRELAGPYLFTPTNELAADLGLSPNALLQAVKRGDLECSRWFRAYMFTPEQAQSAREFYADHKAQEDTAGWLTSAQAAREFGVSAETFNVYFATHPEFQGIQRRRVKRNGRAFRYEPHSVRQALMAFKPRPTPGQLRRAGLQSTKALADLLGVSVTTLSDWARKGAPHERDKNGNLWFYPARLLAWLEARPRRSKQVDVTPLRAHLEAQERTAA